MRLAGYVPTTTQHAALYMAPDQSISIFSDLGVYLLQHNISYMASDQSISIFSDLGICTYYNMQHHIWPLIKVLVSFQFQYIYTR